MVADDISLSYIAFTAVKEKPFSCCPIYLCMLAVVEMLESLILGRRARTTAVGVYCCAARHMLKV